MKKLSMRSLKIAAKLGAKVGSFKQYPNPLNKNSIGLYQSSIDVISLRTFKGQLAEKLTTSTLMHELIHWTGHPNRLARKRFVDPFPSKKLCQFEEWVADMGSFMLLRNFGYHDDWYERKIRIRLDSLPDDQVEKVRKQAEIAATYIINRYEWRTNANRNARKA